MGREMGLDGRMEKSKLEMQFCITMQKSSRDGHKVCNSEEEHGKKLAVLA